MDLSINNRNISNKNISFKGFESSYNKKGQRTFDFFIPPKYVQSLGKDESIVLEFALYNNKTGKIEETYSEKFPEGSNKVSLNEDDVKYITQNSDGLLYRFKIGDKIIYDETEKREVKNGDNKETFNIVKTSPNTGITPKTGTQYHVFLDSNIARQENPYRNTEFDFVHNHFNKLGGNIKGLDYLLTKTDELNPYRYIISNPDIGADPTSSHKYWPNNIYQCTDMEAFKDLNFHCFERGKGYVADGAFTSQSIQSPLAQHVYKWGEQSPWANMLKIDTGSGKIPCIGVLPDNKEAMKHVGVKIVNNPREKGYQRNKPSYIQFFDDRLVSIDSIAKNELIKSTDKNPEDHYEITSNNDSVYMFSFEITPEDTTQLDAFEKAGRNYVMLNELKENKNDFLRFENFRIVNRHSASGATYWDGNRDIIKMNLSNSKNTEANELGMQYARQYIIDAATFWTETIQSDLILKTAQASDKEKAKIAKNNEADFDEIKANLSAPDTRFPVLEQKKDISDYLGEFPLQSIETSPELSAIFAQPDFNDELLGSKDFASKMETAVDSVLDNVILKKFQKEQDASFRNTELFKEYKQYAIKTFAPMIIKTLYAGALNREAVSSDGELINEKLKDITLRGIVIKHHIPDSPKEERKFVIDEIRNGFTRSVLEGAEKKVFNELENVSLDDFKLADAIVSQGKGGLNWRFDAAKDIGDLDAVRDFNQAKFEKIWKETTSFWTDFIANIRKYNPASYVINEITDLGALIEKSEGIDGNAAFEKAKAAENQFLADSGSTTSSNYIFFFHKLACFVGTNTEKIEYGEDENNPRSRAGNLDKLRDSIVDFMKQNQPDNVYLSHSFVENHDKPRVLHTLPLDLELFHSTKIEGNADYEKLAEELTGSKEYSKISPKALAVAQMMNKQIEKDYEGEEKEKLKEALTELTLGKKTKTSPADMKRSEAFGVTPYEISIRDLFEKAGLTDDLDDRVLDFHSSMLSKAMSQQTSMWEMMNAIPGTPTIFNGAEFAQTGWEQKNKNETQANRNPILRSLRNDKRYKNYHDKMLAISGLYKLKGLSPIRDGAKKVLNKIETGEYKELIPDPLGDDGNRKYIINGILNNGGYEAVQKFLIEHPTDEQSTYNAMEEKFGIYHNKDCYDRFIYETKQSNFEELLNEFKKANDCNEQIRYENAQNFELLPIYSYNKKGDEVLQFITNFNVPKSDLARDVELEKPKEIDSIHIDDCPFKDGTILQRKVYKSGKTYSDETLSISSSVPQKYVVQEGTIYPADENGNVNKNKKITVDDTVLTFYKP